MTIRSRHLVVLGVLALSGALTPTLAFAEGEGSPEGSAEARAAASDGLVSRLATLRAEVEALGEELKLAEGERRERRAAALSRIAELSAEQKREALRKERLLDEKARLDARVAEAAQDEQQLLPLVLGALDALEARIEAGLPFRVADRRTEVEGLRARLTAGELAPGQGLLRLWSLLQDELKLTRETGLAKQPIQLGDDEVLAEVVRLGMVALYFSSPDGRVGYAKRDGQGWTYEVVTGEDDVQRLEALFDAQKKQIRSGYFELPLALQTHEPSSTTDPGNTP